jgi:hypothetical protein
MELILILLLLVKEIKQFESPKSCSNPKPKEKQL